MDGKHEGELTVKILSMGEVLWDVFGDEEYLGGAPLNFSAVLQRLGNTAAVLTAVGKDERGIRTLKTMRDLGLSTEFVRQVTERPTGTAFVSMDGDRNAVFTIDRPAAFDCVAVDASLLERAVHFAPDWLYFGTLAQANPHMETALLRLVENLPETRCFYDVNLRSGHWNLALVERLSSAADVLKLNHREAEQLYELTRGKSGYNLEAFCRHWSSTYNISTICVTLGSRGCAIFDRDTLRSFDGFTVEVVDTVGSGDAFAAAFLHGLNAGWPIEENANFANALGALVAGRPGATPDWSLEEYYALIRSRAASRDTSNPSARGDPARDLP
jgi:fructokinase